MTEVPQNHKQLLQDVNQRARSIADAGGLAQALSKGAISSQVNVTVSEGVVLGLMKQGVCKYLGIFGHGCTDLAEILRIYETVGLIKTFQFRNEIAMSHAATTLKWQYGETSAVVTSIGPGALQAMAGSLAAVSNSVGVYHIYGDETTHDEGFNMQQIPKHEQGLFGRLTAIMGESYVLHTPLALRAALHRGNLRVNHPYKAGPFYLLLPINIQPAMIDGLNLYALPDRLKAPLMTVSDEGVIRDAVNLIHRYRKIVIKTGGGARNYPKELTLLAEAVDGVVALSPGALGVLPDSHLRNMHVSGSKGSVSGNNATDNANLLIMVGSRAVCQADCSGIGFPNTQAVININGDLADVSHYNRTVMLLGDIGATIRDLLNALNKNKPQSASEWLTECAQSKKRWRDFKDETCSAEPLFDSVWQSEVLTQPTAIKVVADYAKTIDAVKYFDAGDVQANGFQIAEDDHPCQTFTETGASYMGFAVNALMAAALADNPQYGIAFTGDGSFMMNPQILIDGIEHGLRGMIVIFDNRRMAAITALQEAQYGNEYRTSDRVAVDYVAMASAIPGILAISGGTSTESLLNALKKAGAYTGLSVVHIPVYYGPAPRCGLGAYGSWNVGNWVAEVQAKYHQQNL